MLRKLLESVLYQKKIKRHVVQKTEDQHRKGAEEIFRTTVEVEIRGKCAVVHQVQRTTCPDLRRSESTKRDFFKNMNMSLGHFMDIKA